MKTLPTSLSEVPTRVKGCCVPLATPIPEAQVEALANALRALADPVRIQIVHMLKASSEPVCVCDFTATFEVGQPTISHHLGKLREAGVVTSFKRGVWAFYTLNPEMAPSARQLVQLVP